MDVIFLYCYDGGKRLTAARRVGPPCSSVYALVKQFSRGRAHLKAVPRDAIEILAVNADGFMAFILCDNMLAEFQQSSALPSGAFHCYERCWFNRGKPFVLIRQTMAALQQQHPDMAKTMRRAAIAWGWQCGLDVSLDRASQERQAAAGALAGVSESEEERGEDEEDNDDEDEDASAECWGENDDCGANDETFHSRARAAAAAASLLENYDDAVASCEGSAALRLPSRAFKRANTCREGKTYGKSGSDYYNQCGGGGDSTTTTCCTDSAGPGGSTARDRRRMVPKLSLQTPRKLASTITSARPLGTTVRSLMRRIPEIAFVLRQRIYTPVFVRRQIADLSSSITNAVTAAFSL